MLHVHHIVQYYGKYMNLNQNSRQFLWTLVAWHCIMMTTLLKCIDLSRLRPFTYYKLILNRTCICRTSPCHNHASQNAAQRYHRADYLKPPKYALYKSHYYSTCTHTQVTNTQVTTVNLWLKHILTTSQIAQNPQFLGHIEGHIEGCETYRFTQLFLPLKSYSCRSWSLGFWPTFLLHELYARTVPTKYDRLSHIPAFVRQICSSASFACAFFESTTSTP